MKIVGISDTVLGYGSPQVQKFMAALATHHGTRALVLEPQNPEREPKHELCPEIDIETIDVKCQPYAWPVGRQEYVRKLGKRIDELEPDILVIFCTFCIPALMHMKYRPKKIIYYCIESIVQYGAADVWLNIKYGHLFDAIVFPERNRAAKDSERCLLMDRPSVVMLNCVNSISQPEPVLPPDQRNGRILSQGSIGFKLTFADYFINTSAAHCPIDMYGPISGSEAWKELIRNLDGNVRYKGVVDGKTLAEVRRNYAWGLVTWNPAIENNLYACANKFFEYIASGVPAITAPHPQHVQIIKRFGCGIIMPDWTFESFLWSLGEASRIAQSERYPEYVEACARAIKEELNFEHQFNRFLAVYEGRKISA